MAGNSLSIGFHGRRIVWRTAGISPGICSPASPVLSFCEQCLAAGDWKDVLKLTSSLPEPPLGIVASRLADECLSVMPLAA